MDDWGKLYRAAEKIQNSRVVSPFIEVGGVAAALLTDERKYLYGNLH